MKIVIAPDSFKGTMMSQEVCDIIERAIKKNFPDAETIKIPVADGGEGMVEAYLCTAGGKKNKVCVAGPDFSLIDAEYGILPDNTTAVIEMAAASGIMLAKEPKKPIDATTYGTGQMIVDAVRKGCNRIILGIGGSATMDAGIGMASAMGVDFLDQNNETVFPAARGLCSIRSIDCSRVSEELLKTEIIVACDVKNPACGQNGSAQVFGKQKGASREEIKQIDHGISLLCNIIKEKTGKDIQNVAGTGAAGGLAIPLLAFFNTRLASGIDLVLDAADFEHKIHNADMVITGEGKLDGQSMEGKVPIGIARRAKKAGIPVVAIVGDIGKDFRRVYEEGITAVFSTNKAAVPFEVAKKTCKDDLFLIADSMFSLKAL